MKAIWNNEVIAASEQTIILEGNHYFPPESIYKSFFLTASFHTICPFKGEASYFSINVNGQLNEDAAWYYPNPNSNYQQIKNYVAFWKGVKITE